jgi:hypothetical protein
MLVTPLLNMHPGVERDLEVRHAGRLLTLPYIVNLEISGRGRQDISREAFDGGKPLRMGVGVEIVECLGVVSRPHDRPVPQWGVDGAELWIGPALIGKDQTIVFSLLVNGPVPRLSGPERSLIDVDVRLDDARSEIARRQDKFMAPAAIISFIGTTIWGFFFVGKWWFLSDNSNFPNLPYVVIFGIPFSVMAVGWFLEKISR